MDRHKLADLCRVVVWVEYATGERGLVALFTTPVQAEAFCRAKRLEQGGAADPVWKVERVAK